MFLWVFFIIAGMHVAEAHVIDPSWQKDFVAFIWHLKWYLPLYLEGYQHTHTNTHTNTHALTHTRTHAHFLCVSFCLCLSLCMSLSQRGNYIVHLSCYCNNQQRDQRLFASATFRTVIYRVKCNTQRHVSKRREGEGGGRERSTTKQVPLSFGDGDELNKINKTDADDKGQFYYTMCPLLDIASGPEFCLLWHLHRHAQLNTVMAPNLHPSPGAIVLTCVSFSTETFLFKRGSFCCLY